MLGAQTDIQFQSLISLTLFGLVRVVQSGIFGIVFPACSQTVYLPFWDCATSRTFGRERKRFEGCLVCSASATGEGA